MSESHDVYADEYRTDWDKKPFPKSDKSIIAEDVDEENFTGVGMKVEPPEIGARGLDGYESAPQPYSGVEAQPPAPKDRVPVGDVRSNVDAEFFTGAGKGMSLEIGVGDQDGNEKSIGGKRGGTDEEDRN